MGMEPEKKVINGKSNLTDLKKTIKQIADRINQLKNERTTINDEIAACRARAQENGIPKKALDDAMKYMAMEPEDREGFDTAYQIVREALGLPVTGDLFDFADAKDEAEEAAKEKKGEKSPDLKVVADALENDGRGE